MIVGFVGDVHGRPDALARALDALAGADLVICLGDIVGGPDDVGAVRMLRSRGVLTLQGNHDHWAARLGRYRMADDDRDWLHRLPPVHETPDFLAYHSEYRDWDGQRHWERLFGTVDVMRAFRSRPQRRLFCGHTHTPCVNVLSPKGLAYLAPWRVRANPVLALAPECRYLVNPGQLTDAVVTWDSASDQMRFTFFEEA